MGGRKKSAKKNKPQPEQKNRILGFFAHQFNRCGKTFWVCLFILFAIWVVSLQFLPNPKGFLSFSSDQQQTDQRQTTLFGSVTKIFILGDSTVDSSAYIFTSLPYGIDWPDRSGNDSLGRFSNATRLGLPLPVSFHNWVKDGRKNSRTGVNVASSGCGLLPTTRPPQAIECRNIDDQQLELEMALAKYGASWFDKAVIMISVGGNDIMFSLGLKDPKSFGEELGSEMAFLLEDLHQLGGRKFFINNVGPVGCIPNMRAFSVDKKSCFENMNEAARAYNSELMKVSRRFKEKFNDTIMVADSFKLFEMILEDPLKYGFKNSDGPCCGNWSDSNHMYECKEGSMLCNETERMGYLFFDGAHTTAAANQLFTELCLEGDICSEV
ncbi:hypothetical protein Vadar_023592 [Vaccinium darrowii]|uniref:Uncharacterized protein n=1 Tax=Vaccinium darrowii TaxID=229202 RepID=A0ACB7Y2U7_9ERIC|nr:hypothetical protein Vadar_023592 [Vaccinium darrowii]